MRYTEDNIRNLLSRFDEGLTTEAEEEALKEYFTHSDCIPDEWQPYKELFMSFDTDAYDFTKEEVDAMFTPAPAPVRRLWTMVAAACAIGIIALFLMPPKTVESSHDSQPVCAKTEPTTSPSAHGTPTDSIPTPTTPPCVVAETTTHINVPSHIQEPQPQSEDTVPADEPVEMSEETRIELLLASLMEETPKTEELNIEEEIRQLRIRGERMMSMYDNNKY